MPYRDDDDARRERIAWLERALERERSASSRRMAPLRIAALTLLSALGVARLITAAPDATGLAPRHQHVAFIGIALRANASRSSFAAGTPCALVVLYDTGTHPCEAALTCMGEHIPIGDAVCGASARPSRLRWTAPSPSTPRSIVVERSAGLVIVRPEHDPIEIEAVITSFRDFDLPRQ